MGPVTAHIIFTHKKVRVGGVGNDIKDHLFQFTYFILQREKLRTGKGSGHNCNWPLTEFELQGCESTSR